MSTDSENDSGQWSPCGRTLDFGPGVHLVPFGQRKAGVVIVNDKAYAFHPICPHLGGTLLQSELFDDVLTCPFHGWRFQLSDGGREIHGYRSVSMFETKIENGTLLIKKQA